MAQHLDLEEQEQLAEIKHFWNKYGNLITWTLILALGTFAAWNGWNYWQRQQSAQASALYEEVERAAQGRDAARVQRAFDDVREQFGRTVYAQQAGLLAATALQEAGNTDAAKSALAWVAGEASDTGLRSIAKLRLAAMLAEAKAYDEALKQLQAGFPPAFEGLAADRRGDVLNLQGQKAQARSEYQKALKALGEAAEYRRVVEVKLASLGGDAAAAGAAKP